MILSNLLDPVATRYDTCTFKESLYISKPTGIDLVPPKSDYKILSLTFSEGTSCASYYLFPLELLGV